MEKPKASISANVPTIDTGTAMSGMMEARQVCRNTITTMTTSRIASSRVSTTDSMEWRTKTVGSYTISYSTPSGKFWLSSAIVARTASDSSSALAPGDCEIGIATAS